MNYKLIYERKSCISEDKTILCNVFKLEVSRLNSIVQLSRYEWFMFMLLNEGKTVNSDELMQGAQKKADVNQLVNFLRRKIYPLKLVVQKGYRLEELT